MNRGFMHALESIPVFLIWMILLAGIWQHAAFVVNERADEWKMEKAAERARMRSDILVHKHGETPWFGCATFSEEKKRAMDYWVEQSCLEKLDENAPGDIVHAGFRNAATSIVFLDQNKMNDANATMQCAGAITPIILFPAHQMGVLDVVACE